MQWKDQLSISFNTLFSLNNFLNEFSDIKQLENVFEKKSQMYKFAGSLYATTVKI